MATHATSTGTPNALDPMPHSARSQSGGGRRPRISLIQSGLSAGGTEKVLACLAIHLDQQGYDVTMLSIHGVPETAYYPVPDTIRVRSMAAEAGTAAAARTYRRIAWIRAAIRHQDLALSCLTKINVQTAIAAAGLGVRRIASERNNFLRQPMNALWRKTMPLALGSADAVVMQTEAARDALPRWAARNAVVIPNPVFQPDAGDHETPSPKIVAVGRLCAQKGFDVLLRALAIARDRGTDLPLTIYGVGEEEAALKELARSLKVEDLAAFAGRSEVPHGWAKAPGIFVLSSRFEGFPNVLIEAMSSGFAVLATRCDWGPSEIVTPDLDGLLVRPEDPAAMADGLIRLAADAALRARLSRAAQHRAQDFAAARIMVQWQRAIENVLTARHLRDRRDMAVS